MNTAPSSPRRLLAATAWLAGSVAGWTLVPVFVWGQTLYTYRQVAGALPGYLMLGVFAGAATGLGQALAWQLLGRPGRRWLWASLVGYALALPSGLIISTLLPLLFGWRAGFPLRLPLSEPGSIFYGPFPGDLVFAGFLPGLCQWAALRLSFERPTTSMRLLWIFGVWLGIGLGLFAGGLAANGALLALGMPAASGPYTLLWGAGWGLTIGLVSAAVLWVLRRAPRGRLHPVAAVH